MYGRIIGSTGAVLAVIAIFLYVFILFKSCTGGSGNLSKNPDVQISDKFHVLQRPRFCYTSEKFLCFKLRRSKPSGCDISNSHISTPKGPSSHFWEPFIHWPEVPYLKLVKMKSGQLGATEIRFEESNLFRSKISEVMCKGLNGASARAVLLSFFGEHRCCGEH